GGTLAVPAVSSRLVAQPQQPTVPVVGILHTGSAEFVQDEMRAFHQGLSASGVTDGRNVAIEYRWGGGGVGRLAGFAKDLASRRVAVIVALGGGNSHVAAKEATTTIPVVFSVATDPVATGIVATLNRPSGNLTGVTTLSTQLVAKRLELLHEVLPAV